MFLSILNFLGFAHAQLRKTGQTTSLSTSQSAVFALCLTRLIFTLRVWLIAYELWADLAYCCTYYCFTFLSCPLLPNHFSQPRSHRFSFRKCKGLEKTVLLFSKQKGPGDDIYWAVNRLNFRSEMNWFRKSNSQNTLWNTILIAWL